MTVHLHRNGRKRDPLKVASLADIETEIADILDVTEVIQRGIAARGEVPTPAQELGNDAFQLAEAMRGLAWAIGSLAKHYEELAVEVRAGRAA